MIKLMVARRKKAGAKYSFFRRIFSYVFTEKALLRESWFLASLILFFLTVIFGIGFGTFFFNFISNGVYASIEKKVNLADTCNATIEPKQVTTVIVTAYSSAPEQTDNTPCITATGYDVCANYALYGKANTIASNFLPLHTLVKIPEIYGDQLFVVRDRMNARFGYNNIDLWMPTDFEARGFGTQQLKIEIY